MATGGEGGGGEELDSGVTCSVCFEPYRGRQAKLLPCFHTFCLPCLRGIVKIETEVTLDRSGLSDKEAEGRSPNSLTCPTCRRVIPLPPGGVAGFQPNFYVDSSNTTPTTTTTTTSTSSNILQKDTQPQLCSLCDGDCRQRARFLCSQCHNTLCSPCRRAHDKCCQGSQVTALPGPPDAADPARQLQRVEEALETLREEEQRLCQDRRAMDDSISRRFTTLLRQVTEARDLCCRSLKDACDGLGDGLRSRIAEAQHARDTLQQQLSSSSPSPSPSPSSQQQQLKPAPVSTSQLRAALFLQGDLQEILNRDLGGSPLLRHCREEDASLVSDALQSFMGKVVPADHTSATTESSEPPDSEQAEPGGKSSNDLREKVEALTVQVTSLLTANTRLSQHVTLLDTANSRLSAEQSSLQREVAELRDGKGQLDADLCAVKREAGVLRDKQAILQQDLALLTSEKDKARAGLAGLHEDVIAVQTDVSLQQTDILKLEAGAGDAATKLGSAQSQLAALQAQDALSKADVTRLRADCGEMKSDVTKMQVRLASVEGGQSGLHTVVTASQGEIASLQKRVQLLVDSLKDDKKALGALQKQFRAANAQVGFHARLSQDETVDKTVQALVCSEVFCNAGGGYSATSGVFTAPVPGLYAFLVNACPNQPNTEDKAKLDIVVDSSMRGYVFAKGHSWSTGHTVARLAAGQRVWLRTYGDREYKFARGGWTFFSGVLVQADV